MEYKSLKELVISYLGGVCVHCGAMEHLHVHHTTPIYAGGSNSMGNVEVACSGCHHKLHTQLIKIYPTATQRKKLNKEQRKKHKASRADKAAAIIAVKKLISLGIIGKNDLPENFRTMM